ncbi:hypothetical protein N7532_004892 [Penicillium argentinense]|uniref:Uncharacterized protein n=1 Tax=Penicillium argentinense TaxID=1131581 RepID=A0A9W9K9U4_9EURO|nr:uncharacterized protein N7532_004892 [Penicillium argentinense]KAJ5097891.1 hypothetical protein N7532_004892 [Penicillium argentinense]
MEEYELVISGAVGGTWAKERLYPDLKTNNLIGSYELSDFPMELDRFQVSSGSHNPRRSCSSIL